MTVYFRVRIPLATASRSGVDQRVITSTFPLRWVVLLVLVVSSVGLASCRNPSGPTPPPPPPVEALSLTCPAGVILENAPTTPVPVSYAPPVSLGGAAPVDVTCTHPSGGNFNLGTTDVICTAKDAATPQRQASCVFSVTVKQSFSVAATKFLAFGDSITEGEVSYNVASGSIRPQEIETSKAYPTILRGLLSERYPQQSTVVHNAGNRGEPAACVGSSTFCGASRISGEIRATTPHVLLLLQGVVDLASNPSVQAIDTMVGGLKSMIRDAKARGVSHVFLATLLPEKRGCCPIDRSYAIDYIVPGNNEIRHLAAQENVILVDVYAAMVGKEDTLIGTDGLHPTPEGYIFLANVFFDAIKNRLETVVTTPAGASRMLRVSATNGADVEVGSQFFRPPIWVRQR